MYWRTISTSTLLLYCLLVHGIPGCQCNSLPISAYNYWPLVPHMIAPKRNIFMSRGWGAAGTPFNNLFLTPPMPLQQKYHSELNYQQLPPKQELRRSSYPVEEEELPVAEYLIQPPPQEIEETSYRNDLHSKNHHVIPQLFVSYGWGPLGK